MSITITLPAEVEKGLQAKAEAQQVSLDELIVDILVQAVETEPDEDFPSLEEVVAEIKATPPNPASIRPARGSLAEALANSPEDPDFQLETVDALITAVALRYDLTLLTTDRDFNAVPQLKQENWLL